MDVSIVVEAQQGLTWGRWVPLVEAVDALVGLISSGEH
jgi:hypothetical protein